MFLYLAFQVCRGLFLSMNIAKPDWIMPERTFFPLTPSLLYSPHRQNVHGPLQVPTEWTDLYPNVTYEPRQKCLGMISVVDSAIQNITEALKAKGLWDNALVIFSSDNGMRRVLLINTVQYVNALVNLFTPPISISRRTCRPCQQLSLSRRKRHRVRLRKDRASFVFCTPARLVLTLIQYNSFEGGTRIVAFATGGYLPERMQGKTVNGLMHTADWFVLFWDPFILFTDRGSPLPLLGSSLSILLSPCSVNLGMPPLRRWRARSGKTTPRRLRPICRR